LSIRLSYLYLQKNIIGRIGQENLPVKLMRQTPTTNLNINTL